MNRSVRIIKGFVALAVLAGLFGGVPWALWLHRLATPTRPAQLVAAHHRSAASRHPGQRAN
jgi:hypothetical protein